MAFQVVVGAESVRTFLAAKLLPIMLLHVSPQPSFAEEFGATHLTLLRFFTMAKQVLPEASPVLKGFGAGRECAREGVVFVVVGHVVVQVLFLFKDFTTVRAQSQRLTLLFPQVLVHVCLKASF